MERSNKHNCMPTKRLACLRADRSGKITIVTIFAILGLIVLAGFVGNAGHVVTTKVLTQNAADSITFSSAQWMARGMNAVTATNHLLGEVTGLVVVVEALGGPEADLDRKAYPQEPRMFDQLNKSLGEAWVPKGGYGASAYGGAEKPIIGGIVDIVSPKDEEKAKFKAFATIYDSKLVLKRNLTKHLLVKTVANIGFMVPAPFGIPTAIAAYIVHIYSSYKIIDIGLEYVILEGLELLSTKVKYVKVNVIEDHLIPALAAHGDFIAGKSPAGINIGTGIVNNAVSDTLAHLGKTYKVDAQIFPAARDFVLPIEAEPAPSMQGSTIPEAEWGKDESLTASIGDIEDELKETRDKMSKPRQQIIDRITQLNNSIKGGDGASPPEGLDGLEKNLREMLQKNPPAEDRTKIEQEIAAIGQLRNQKQARINLLNTKLGEMDRQINEANAAIAKAKNAIQNVFPGNLSVSNIPLEMNQAEERYTQWVRATYPYVDAFRAPVLAQFEEHLDTCEAAKHFRRWTDRFTLVKAWKFRSGSKLEATAGTEDKAEWKKGSDDDRLAMYVMKGAYDQGAKRLNKGHETWTEDTRQGRQEAERMFTVIGITQRTLKPLFSPVIYPSAVNNGITTFAQAIFYNGNEQKPPAQGAKEMTQAKVGWDTLNWDPTAATPEWGRAPSKSNAKWPWEIFSRSPDRVGSARVRLNWQAKLMPVTKSRFAEAAAADVTNPDMDANLKTTMKFFDPLVTH